MTPRRPHERTKRLGSSSSSSTDGGMIRIVVALIAGGGAAFLLAVIMLASRLGEVEQDGGIMMTTLTTMTVDAGVISGGRKEMVDPANKLLGEKFAKPAAAAAAAGGGGDAVVVTAVVEEGRPQTHRIPPLFFPPLPPNLMAEEVYGTEIVPDLLERDAPTIAGIIAIMQRFLSRLRMLLAKHRDEHDAVIVLREYYALVDEILRPFESSYRDRPIFPIREDESIFISLAAYRDHLLGATLRQAYKYAAYPEKLFVGAVVQNCFGIDVQCKTGVEVKGKDEKGQWITKISDKGPDVNGIEEFCSDPLYSKYCIAGHIRVLYVNETESNGPTQARYFASKLWGGETYFMQVRI